MNVISSVGLVAIDRPGLRGIVEAWAGDGSLDIEATTAAYAEAVQALLPEGCSLCPAGVVVDTEVDDDLRAAIRAALDEIDLAAIAV